MRDREALWNIVQNKFDTRVNSVFSQEVDVALPIELGVEENEKLLTEYVEEILFEYVPKLPFCTEILLSALLSRLSRPALSSWSESLRSFPCNIVRTDGNF